MKINQLSQLKDWLFNILKINYSEDIETPVGRGINLTIGILVLVSSGIFVAQTYPISETVRTNLNLLDNGILFIFAIEYLLRFWCADNKRQHFFSLYSLIDFIAIVPFFGISADTSFLRILRWFRFLRLIRLLGNKTFLGRRSHEDSIVFARIIFTLLAIVFVFSGLIYQVEHPVNPSSFKTFLDAFYFSIFTMTTVGYGDVTPVSESGRLLTVLMVLIGIALIPVQLGDLFKRLVKTANHVDIPCAQCGLSMHDPDANYCKNCGTVLNI
jgi:voltage-gated potassium channel